MIMSELTHFNESGQAQMVDVGHKPATERTATATGLIRMAPETLTLIAQGDAKKGDVLGVARLAGIMGAKRTADLIPLCHPLPLTQVCVDFNLEHDLPGVRCQAQARTTGPTGVEMEALTAVHVALLTIYDMCKAVDRGMTMEQIGLAQKSGGSSGTWQRPAEDPADR